MDVKIVFDNLLQIIQQNKVDARNIHKNTG
jgi:hypothetical protein